MGLLISITLAVALLAELFLLPVLVMGLMRKEKKVKRMSARLTISDAVPGIFTACLSSPPRRRS